MSVETNISRLVIGLDGSIIDKVNGFITALNQYSNTIQVVAPFDASDSVSMNFYLRNARISNYTQYMRLAKDNTGTPLKGSDVIEPSRGYYQMASDWYVWQMPISSKALRAISKYHAGSVDISVTFREFKNLYIEDTASFKGTFGSNKSTTAGDLPATATEGDYYRCDYLNFHSNTSNLDFTLLDIAIWNTDKWIKGDAYEERIISDSSVLAVDPAILGQAITDVEPTVTEMVIDRISNLESVVLFGEPSQEIIENFLTKNLDSAYLNKDTLDDLDRLYLETGIGEDLGRHITGADIKSTLLGENSLVFLKKNISNAYPLSATILDTDFFMMERGGVNFHVSYDTMFTDFGETLVLTALDQVDTLYTLKEVTNDVINNVSNLTADLTAINADILDITIDVTDVQSLSSGNYTRSISNETEISNLVLSISEVDDKTIANSTLISQNTNDILLKANQTSLDTVSGLISANTTSIGLNANDILLKANQTALDSTNGVVSSHTTSIGLNASNILLKASQIDLNSANSVISSNTASIGVNASNILLKANQTALDSTNSTVSSHTTSIGLNATNIALKASQVDLNTANSTISSHTTSIGLNASNILLKANQTALDTANGLISSNTSAISVNAGQIALKANQTALNTTNGNVTANTAAIGVNATAITLRATSTDLSYEVAQLTQYIDDIETALSEQIDGSISYWFGTVTPTVSNYPAVDWTTDAIRDTHIADVFINETDSKSYRFKEDTGVYSWIEIIDTQSAAALSNSLAALTLAGFKSRIFFQNTQPVNGYEGYYLKTNDIWINSSDVIKYYDNVTAPSTPVWVQKIDYKGYTDAAITVESDAIKLEVSNTYSTIVDTTSLTGSLAADILALDGDITTLEGTISGIDTDLSSLTTVVTNQGTSITQNATAITLKADQTVYTTLSGIVTDNTNDIITNADGISTNATNITNNDADIAAQAILISNQSTAITQNATDISLRATTETVNTLTGRVSTAETNISLNDTEIALKADQTSLDTLSGTVSTQGTAIIQNANDITLKANQTSLDTLSGTVTTQGTAISANATAITLKADQTVLNTLSGTVTTQGTLISQNANEITLRATSSEVDSLSNTVSENTTALEPDNLISSINIASTGITILGSKIDIIGNTTFSSLSTSVTDLDTDLGSLSTSVGTIDSDLGTLTSEVSTIDTNLTTAEGNISGIITDLETGTSTKVTTINGGKITTGTIDASLVTVTNLNASNITSGTIDASVISVTNLNADNITSGTVTATVLNAATGTFTGTLSGVDGTFSGSLSGATGTFAGSLSAATGSFSGAVTATSLSLTNNAVITKGLTMGDITNKGFINSYGTTATSGTGFYLNGTGTFRFGDPNGNRVTWDGTTLEVYDSIIDVDLLSEDALSATFRVYNRTSLAKTLYVSNRNYISTDSFINKGTVSANSYLDVELDVELGNKNKIQFYFSGYSGDKITHYVSNPTVAYQSSTTASISGGTQVSHHYYDVTYQNQSSSTPIIYRVYQGVLTIDNTLGTATITVSPALYDPVILATINSSSSAGSGVDTVYTHAASNTYTGSFSITHDYSTSSSYKQVSYRIMGYLNG